MTRRSRPPSRRRSTLLAAAAVLAAGACGSATPSAPSAAPPAAVSPPTAEPAPQTQPAEPTEQTAPAPTEPVSFGFVGDIHAEGSAERVIEDGLGGITDLLGQQDVVVGNLETAILTDPSAADPEPKRFTFAAPPALLGALHGSGIDVVTLANNHGMDYGAEGLQQTLAATAGSPLVVLGAGQTAAEAYTPWTTEIDGTRVAVLAATDVLDAFAEETWPATEDEAGLASSKGSQQQVFVDAVRQAAQQADVVAVYLHWGREREVCPTERQQELAAAVAEAGADVIVGSHAHVVQPAGDAGDAFVHYGLGNFVWYSSNGSPSSVTGVLTVTVDPDAPPGDDTQSTWHPAAITSGVPVLDGEPAPPPTDC